MTTPQGTDARQPRPRSAITTALNVGDEAFCIVSESSGKARETVRGAARVRVVAVDGESYRVEVVLNCAHLGQGQMLELDRAALFSERDKVERHDFAARVRLYWGWRSEAA